MTRQRGDEATSDELIRNGSVEEEDILDDFQNVDYLTTEIERIQELLKGIWETVR
jgi:hypothetical protein